MSSSTITLNGNSVTLVATPTSPAPKSVVFTMNDAVASVTSKFTGQVQTFQWPGADMWSGTVTLPPLVQADADNWISFLMELRGMSYAFQTSDPLKATPRGTPLGTPVANNAVSWGNAAGSPQLGTSGWVASAENLLLPGDYIQVGYRLYRVLDAVDADASGNATITVWPSLREQPTAGETVITTGAQGLFRLAANKRTWSADETLLTSISFGIQEYR
jgi:hypothetical protein